MRLLQLQDDGTFSLTSYVGKYIPPYAILSHTWGADHEEITFEDIAKGTGNSTKIQFCGKQAIKDGLQHFWVDTCCIDKSSSAELSEAINSMFRWYQNATRCYVYLSDVSVDASYQYTPSSPLPCELAFRQSRWFTRGWTLQETIASSSLQFFSREGILLGDKTSLEHYIHEITGIAIQALQGTPLSDFSIAERISWAANRETTIEEDQVYCLLGIFDVHMPLIYGEGMEHAFRRLRKEIPELGHALRLTDDASAVDKAEACLANLAATDQTRFLSQTLSRSKNTCAWILKNDKYTAWHESAKSSLLWITAKAGCGKTTMAAHISQMVSTNRNSGALGPQKDKIKSVVLCFFFRRTNREAEKTALAALRTVISQLVHQEPQALPTLLKRHDLLSAKGAFDWSWENLSGVLGEMLEQIPLSTRVYIILDAADECEAKSRMLILDWVKGIVDEAHLSAPRRLRPVLKILVTSRPDGDILDCLYDFPNLQITDADTANDMKLLIHSRVEEFARHRDLNPNVARSIASFLEANAQGMFLWVVLVMKELERRDERLSDEVIMSRLSNIPLTLIDTYETIIRHTFPSRKKDMWRIIRWLIFGSRNLTLAELEGGMCLETGVSSWHGFAGDVNFLCGSLVRFDGPREEISLVHQTARGFLEGFTQRSSSTEVAGLDLDACSANEHLATICVRYLLREEVRDLYQLLMPIRSRTMWMDTISNLLRRYPFLRYAIESWALHIRAAGTPSSEITSMVHRLISSPAHRSSIMILTFFITKDGNSEVPLRQSPLHLAAYFNLPWLVDSYIAQDRGSVDAESETNDIPLVWASEMGSTECAKKLLEAGSDPNKFEYDGWSALHWAARNGHLDIVTLLLSYGSRFDQQDSGGYTPLDWALDREHWDVVGVLQQWADKNGSGKADSSLRQPNPMGKTGNTRAFRNAWQLWDWRP